MPEERVHRQSVGGDSSQRRGNMLSSQQKATDRRNKPRASMTTGRSGTRTTGMSSRRTGTKVRATGGEAGAASGVPVVMENGVNVTPKPLGSLKPTVLGAKGSSLLDKTPTESPTASEGGGGGGDADARTSSMSSSKHGYSYNSASSSGSSPRSSQSGATSPRHMDEEAVAGAEGATAAATNASVAAAAAAAAAPMKERELTEAELEHNVYLTLCETETMWLLDLPARCVGAEYAEAPVVQAANDRYAAVLAAREGSEMFTAVATQTVDALRKTKEAQTQPKTTSSSDCQVNLWDIVDALEVVEDGGDDDTNLIGGKTSKQSKDDKEPTAAQLAAAVDESDSVTGGGSVAGGLGTGSNSATTTGIGQSSLLQSTTVGQSSVVGSVNGTGGAAAAGGGGGGTEAAAAGLPGTEAVAAEAPLVNLSTFENLGSAMTNMERAVCQNIFHDKLLAYRNFRPRDRPPPSSATTTAHEAATTGESSDTPRMSAAAAESVAGDGSGVEDGETTTAAAAVAAEAAAAEAAASTAAAEVATTTTAEDPSAEAAEEGAPAMHHLWDFQCALTEGRNVSCLAANHLHQELLAVGYGQYDFDSQQGGLVAFWSLKNPRWPDWVFHAPCGVTALAFSKLQPSLLAVGFYSGMVSIYDVRTPTTKPTLEASHTAGKHSDPVWKLQWVQRGGSGSGGGGGSGEVVENLVSISTDGRVTQWSIKKGLEHQDLMRLKRLHRRTIPDQAVDQLTGSKQSSNKTEAFISRRGSGMCFDFSPKDPTVYIVGTEDGNIHKCSCSYSEQYLQNYFGHSGPLYQIQWSPFARGLFLSASADWTVKLWAEENPTALITFQSGNDEVADLQWSPYNSTVLGTVTVDGRLEIWDLATSTLKPALHTKVPDSKLSCMLFLEGDPIVMTGGSNGAVSVFRLVGVDPVGETFAAELARLQEAMSSNIISVASDPAKDKQSH